MKTYLRCSMHVGAMEYPFKAPEYVQREADALKERCRQYELKNANDIFLIPIDTEEYSDVLAFYERYKEYATGNLFYEHKFTKSEMEKAEYYFLKCGTLVETLYEENEIYTHCCNGSNIREKQIGFYKMKKSSMGKRVIACSYDYCDIVSKEVKEAFEKEQLTNLKMLPVYDKQEKEILAYQLDAESTLPPLAEINNWIEYRRCPQCNKIVWKGIHILNHPLYMPLEWKEELKDINCTLEIFPSGGRYYIISKKTYNILQDLGAKKLMCEPIVFI